MRTATLLRMIGWEVEGAQTCMTCRHFALHSCKGGHVRHVPKLANSHFSDRICGRWQKQNPATLCQFSAKGRW